LIVYFDTSALVKLLVSEHGSELAEELWLTATTRVACRLAYPSPRGARRRGAHRTDHPLCAAPLGE
jgi:predicted nucleic acid-binding protein